jgi:prepilin-type processing-associated H-X9-DG protein/prepilin-type N-terminal cleavage/methylation domain-containing protein
VALGSAGLTLIELLVAVGIIAILAGMISAALIAAGRKARQTVCASNLRQIAEAVRLYAMDHDGVPPKARTFFGGWIDWRTKALLASLRPYGATPEVWFCPSDPDRGKWVIKDDVQHWLTSYRTSGWETNMGDPYLDLEPPDIIGFNESACKHFYWIAGDARNSLDPNFWRPGVGPASWHSGGYNVAYIDGHVKWVPMRRAHEGPPNPFVTEPERETSDD